MQTLSAKLSWSHFTELLNIKNDNKINYYIKIVEEQNLAVRERRYKIKSNEYERLDEKAREKLINKEEFENVEFKEFDMRLIHESTLEYGSYYIEFNNKNFLNTQTLRFKSDTILIEVEKELIDSLNKEVI